MDEEVICEHIGIDKETITVEYIDFNFTGQYNIGITIHCSDCDKDIHLEGQIAQ